MCILQEGEAQNLLVIDELMHHIFRGISSKLFAIFCERLLDLNLEID